MNERDYEVDLKDVFDCLMTRRQCQGDKYFSQEEATKEHMANIRSYIGAKEEKEERAKLERGNQYWSQGYSLKFGSRHIVGHAHIDDMPGALHDEFIDAGYIATSPAVRRAWVINRQTVISK